MHALPNMTEACSLALHAVALLATEQESWLQTKEMASVLGASPAHLSKVLQRLRKAGVIQAERGPKGGFRLARGAGSATLREVYEAIEGPLPCPHRSEKTAGDRAPDVLDGLLIALNHQICDYLSATTVDQLGGIQWERGLPRLSPAGRPSAGALAAAATEAPSEPQVREARPKQGD